MKRKTARANNAFLLGSLILIVLVLVIIVLFMFLAFKIYDKKDEGYTERYDIVLGTTTLGNPLSVYVNDSLIFDGTPQSALTLSVGRFTEESTLLIVDGKTDVVSTIALPDHSEIIRLGKREDKFFRE